MPNISDIAKNLGIKSKKDLADKLAEQGVPKEAVTDENLKEVNKAVRGSAVVAQQGQDPTQLAVSDLKAADPASIEEKPKEEKPKNLAGQQAIYAALAAAIPTVLGAAFGGAEGGAIGARAGGASAKEFLGGIEKQKQEEIKLAAMAAEKEKEGKEFALKERGTKIQEEELGIKRGEVASKREENKLRAEETAALREQQKGQQMMSSEDKLRDDFMKNQVVKNYDEATQGVLKLRELSKSKSPSGSDDIALIYAFMKAQDPGSVVREGEYATAQKYSGTLLDSYGIKLNRVLGGKGILRPDQRAALMKTAETLHKGIENQYAGIKSQFDSIAQARGLDPNKVLVGYSPMQDQMGAAPLAKRDLTQVGAAPGIVQTKIGAVTKEELLAEIENRKKMKAR